MSMTYIVHIGTGTIIAADECLIVDIPDEVTDELTEHGGDDYFDDNLIISLAQDNGKPINTTDLKWGNTISFSPTSLREEANAFIDGGIYGEGDSEYEAFVWCANTATDDELSMVASYILDNDDLWDSYKTSVIDGLRQGLAWHNEGEK